MDKLTEFEKWLIDQALDRYLTEASAQLDQDEAEGKRSIYTSKYMELIIGEIYHKLKLGEANGNTRV